MRLSVSSCALLLFQRRRFAEAVPRVPSAPSPVEPLAATGSLASRCLSLAAPTARGGCKCGKYIHDGGSIHTGCSLPVATVTSSPRP